MFLTKGPGRTTVKGAYVKGVSKRLKHSYFRFSSANSGLKEVSPQCAVAPLVLRWTVHGAPTAQRLAGAYIIEGHCYLIGSS